MSSTRRHQDTKTPRYPNLGSLASWCLGGDIGHLIALWLIALTLLASCGPSAAPPTPRPTLRPLVQIPTARRIDPAPTVVAAGAELPGRLLFVQSGNIWLWQGAAGRQLTTSGATF